jgi:hypothetical protein
MRFKNVPRSILKKFPAKEAICIVAILWRRRCRPILPGLKIGGSIITWGTLLTATQKRNHLTITKPTVAGMTPPIAARLLRSFASKFI